MNNWLVPIFLRDKEPVSEEPTAIKKTENAALNPSLVKHLDQDTSSDSDSSEVKEVKADTRSTVGGKTSPIVLDAAVETAQEELEDFAPFTLTKTKTFTW